MISPYEPIPDPVFERLPKSVKDQLQKLYDGVLLRRPKEAIAILQPLLEQYPNVPQLYNYLNNAYQALGDQDKAQQILEETLDRFPAYLFGRISYAHDCLRQGKPEKVPELFDGNYELSLLYPRRKLFHISEVLGFNTVIAWYFHAQGEPDRAEVYYGMMQQLEPGHPNTRFVKQLLNPSWRNKLVRGLLGKES